MTPRSSPDSQRLGLRRTDAPTASDLVVSRANGTDPFLLAPLSGTDARCRSTAIAMNLARRSEIWSPPPPARKPSTPGPIVDHATTTGAGVLFRRAGTTIAGCTSSSRTWPRADPSADRSARSSDARSPRREGDRLASIRSIRMACSSTSSPSSTPRARWSLTRTKRHRFQYRLRRTRPGVSGTRAHVDVLLDHDQGRACLADRRRDDRAQDLARHRVRPGAPR